MSARLIRSLVHPDRTASVTALAYSRDGSRLFAAGYPSGVVQVWDPAAGKELRRVETPRGYRGSFRYVELAPDWATIYVPVDGRKVTRTGDGDNGRVRIEYAGAVRAWDLPTGRDLPPLQPSAPSRGVLAAYLSPTGDKLVALEAASYTPPEDMPFATVIWDLKSRTVAALGDGYGMAAFSPDGKTVAVTFFATKDQPSRLTAFDAASRREIFSVKSASAGRGFSWPVVSPDGRTVAVVDGAGRVDKQDTMRLFDLGSGREQAAFPRGGNYALMEPVFSPDGKRLAAADYNGGLTLWDVTAKTATRMPVPGGMYTGRRVAFSTTGTKLALLTQPKSDSGGVRGDPDPQDLPQPRVCLFDVAKPVAMPEVLICPHGYLGDLAFRPDGMVLAVGGAGAVHLFDVGR